MLDIGHEDNERNMIGLESNSFQDGSQIYGNTGLQEFDAELPGISTDLMPTLLNMYDALFSKLSEPTFSGSKDDLCGSKGKPCIAVEKQTKTPPVSSCHDSEAKDYQRDDTISSVTSVPTYSTTSGPSCVEVEFFQLCADEGTPKGDECFPADIWTNCHINDDAVGEALLLDHDYDIPESIETPLAKDGVSTLVDESDAVSEVSEATKNKPFGGSFHYGERSPPSPKIVRGDHRPLSSISSGSTSSSSSSYTFTNRTSGSVAPSYLASAESLNESPSPGDPEGRTGDPEASRRKDRGLIKARREKALRAGSDDSGVQCHSISLPAPPSERPRYCDPNLSFMDRVVLEIVETEDIYVRDLKEVIEGYLIHWQHFPDMGIPSHIVQNLFSNIEEIYCFNRDFLKELEQCGTDPVRVAECFVRNNSGFAVYTEYCTNYPRTVSVLTDLMKEESSVRACRERQLSLGQTLPLGSYLLKPVQRVLKYHLLLGNILKHFSKDGTGYALIWNALSSMTGIAHHINDMKRKHEHAVRVQEIQSLLYGWEREDLTTFGELAAEGSFRMFGCKGPRHVFLFDKMLLVTKKKDENILLYKAHILCSDLMLIESVPRQPLSFDVIPFHNPKRQYTLECKNLEQKREWTLQLKRVILENYTAIIPDHVRQLVMDLGQAKPNGEPRGGGGGGRRAHGAPEYLERRKERRRTPEGSFNYRLKIRKSLRKKKEKDNQSHPENGGQEDELKLRRTSTPIPPVGEKIQLKLPNWRRRSDAEGGRGSSPIWYPEEGQEADREEVAENVGRGAEESLTSSCNGLDTREVTNDSLFSNNSFFADVEEENLERIVSQLLHHQLQVQKQILNKHRRGIIRQKKLGQVYISSESDEDDSCPPLPTSPPPSLVSDSPASSHFAISNDYVELVDYVAMERMAEAAAIEWTLDAASVSSYSSNSLGQENEDHPLRSRSSTLSKISLETKDKQEWRHDIAPSRVSQPPLDFNKNSLEFRERPATIALYDDFNYSDKMVPKYITNGKKLRLAKEKAITIGHHSIHPEHKIYSKVYVRKGSIRNIICRLKALKSDSIKAISEPSTSLSNLFSNNETKKSFGNTKTTGLVSSLAKHCSKTLKEKIAQITAEDTNSGSTESDQVFSLPDTQCCGSPCVGARLAASDESDYAVPSAIRLGEEGLAFVHTIAPMSSKRDTIPEVDEETLSIVSDESGDSFYEKSFEAIEAVLEDEMFRDSAIYSDTDDWSPRASMKRVILSPKSSFRSNSFKDKCLENELTPRRAAVSSSMSLDSGYVNCLDSPLDCTSSSMYLETDAVATQKIGPPIPARPERLVQRQLRHLQENINTFQSNNEDLQFVGIKSVEERMEELRHCTEKKGFKENCAKYSKVTTSLIEDSSSPNAEEAMSTGWVKHIIGKLQQ